MAVPLPKPRAFSGLRGRVYVGDVQVGWASQIAGTVTFMRQEVRVLGDHLAQELPLTGVQVRCTVGRFGVLNESLWKAGILPRGTTVDMVEWPDMDIKFRDQLNGDLYCRLVGAVPDSFDFNVDSTSVVIENTGWQALNFFADLDA